MGCLDGSPCKHPTGKVWDSDDNGKTWSLVPIVSSGNPPLTVLVEVAAGMMDQNNDPKRALAVHCGRCQNWGMLFAQGKTVITSVGVPELAFTFPWERPMTVDEAESTVAASVASDVLRDIKRSLIRTDPRD